MFYFLKAPLLAAEEPNDLGFMPLGPAHQVADRGVGTLALIQHGVDLPDNRDLPAGAPTENRRFVL